MFHLVWVNLTSFLAPVQFLSSAVRAKPLLQRHLKLPMVLRQFPCVHRPWNTLHSFTSARGRNTVKMALQTKKYTTNSTRTRVFWLVFHSQHRILPINVTNVTLNENPCHLCRTACRSEFLLCWQSRALWGRWLCTRRWLVWDTPRSRRPRPNPPNSSTCRRGISPAAARRTRPRATSSSTAHYAYLERSGEKVLSFVLVVHWHYNFGGGRTVFRCLCGAAAVFLPTHVRPVLSSVRPSAHSQRNEPWVFTQRPFVHTPGNTSHSLMSKESGTF